MGRAFIFVPLLALSSAFAGIFAAYAAGCMFAVVHDTAGGADEVDWRGELFFEKLRNGVVVLGLLALALVPAGILARSLRMPLLLLAAPAAGLLFPPIFLFTMRSRTAGGRWGLARPGQAWRLLPAWMAFLAASLALLAGVVALWHLTFRGYGLWLTFLAAGAGSAALLIYGRLLGRLAFLIGELEWKKVKPKKRSTPRRSPRGESSDPWAVPPEAAEPEAHLPVEGYHVAPVGAAPLPPQHVKDTCRTPVEGYQVSAPDQVASPEPVRFSDFDRRMQEQAYKAPTRPDWPLVNGVYSFPFRTANVGVLVALTVGGLMLAFLANALGFMRPL